MSLRLRLLGIIGLSLILIWSAVAIWVYLDIERELQQSLDDRLAASARMVAGLVSHLPVDGGPNLAAPHALDVIARDGTACEVSLARGEVALMPIARTTSSPSMDGAAPGFGTHTFGGKPWRTFVLIQGGIRIATADRLDVREALLHDVAWGMGLPFAAALVATLAALWFGIGRGLLPIEKLRATLARRRPDDDQPLPETKVPAEMQPLVATLRSLLLRVHGAIARERRFTDNAAHELRTPLTAIKTHLQVARLAAGRPAAQEVVADALSAADEGVRRLQSTLEQLLLLARLDGSTDSGGVADASVGACAQRAVQEAAAGERSPGRVRVDGLETAGGRHVQVPGVLLVAALRNLLENALKYSPPDSPVVLALGPAANGRVSLAVIDEGPGLTEGECAQAVQRFWRGSARDIGGGVGSGLGLSIVDAIATRHGGRLELRGRRDRSGLEARLWLPAGTAS